jgi:pyruvate dehydrogenase E2 component (dihydrolipoamide acetyltransferase)
LHSQVNVRALSLLREQLVGRLEQQFGVHLTFTDLLIKLTAHALGGHPDVRAQWADGSLRRQEAIHIGVAVEAPAGLFVPVLRDADRLGLAGIARWRMETIERTRSGKLVPADLEGGVFTISNLGMYRVDWFEAILNPPQAAILSVGRIIEEPVVERGAVVVAPILKLGLAVDHRVLDGAKAARFLTDLAELIENPALALA